MDEHGIPLGHYPYTVTCSGCGREIHTHTDANLSDPEVAAFVERLSKLAKCDTCKAFGQAPRRQAPWEHGD